MPEVRSIHSLSFRFDFFLRLTGQGSMLIDVYQRLLLPPSRPTGKEGINSGQNALQIAPAEICFALRRSWYQETELEF